MSSNTRPNIVFIHAESMDGRKMGCMGHPAMKNATPNMDRLANEGTMFSNAYTNCPVCNPSRASMWSGKYPNYYDCWNNHEGLRDHIPTFQNTFESAGYQMAAIGPIDYAYGKHSIRDRVGSWTRSAYIQRPINKSPLPQVVDSKTVHQRDQERTDEAISWLHDAVKQETPFMLYLTTGLVHPAFVSDPKHMAMIDDSQIDIPPGLKPLDDSDHPADAYMRITKSCKYPFPENLVREIRHIYFAMIAELDELVGQVLRALDELGLKDNTYVIFSSDHGEMAGEQNQILKRSMYEPSSHVALIARGPGVQKGATVETPVSLIDLYPTFLDMAGISYADFAGQNHYPDTLDGESLLPQLTGKAERQRDWAFCEYHGDRCCTGTFLLRRGDWKYIKNMGYDSQLFNLAQDPWETTNLASENTDVANELDRILTDNFDCEGIDNRAKQYDRENFTRWRTEQKADGTYEEMMSTIYSGFSRLNIEDMIPWTQEDEAIIENWLAS
ncbi:MAG: sulfatase-like hydrolase/transferase [bacterium]|nr:sulfatase-like hydrolase/transferase [bacterium]